MVSEKKKYIWSKIQGVDFVALIGIPTRGQGVRHMGIFVSTRLSFHLSKIGLGMRLGPHEKVDGICGLVMGCHTHKEE
jgi:hypothetical protein